MCQLMNIQKMGLENSYLGDKYQGVTKWVRKRKSDLFYVISLKRKIKKNNSKGSNLCKALDLKPGDLVRVLSKKEIKKTLDPRGRYEGCTFTPLMWQHCGKEYRVRKVIENFYDEVYRKMVRCKRMVILDGVLCEGTFRSFGNPCDRNCFLFWKDAWLEKIDS